MEGDSTDQGMRKAPDSHEASAHVGVGTAQSLAFQAVAFCSAEAMAVVSRLLPKMSRSPVSWLPF